jgi:hypothetical protein
MILNYKPETMWEEMDMPQLKVVFRISSAETEATHRESAGLPSFQMGFKPDTSQMSVGWIFALSTHFMKQFRVTTQMKKNYLNSHIKLICSTTS